jgi:hypothetical protein
MVQTCLMSPAATPTRTYPGHLVAAGAPMACVQTRRTSPTPFESGPARLSGRGITTPVASSRRTLRIPSFRGRLSRNGNVWANTAGLWKDVHAGRMCMAVCLRMLLDAFGVCASDRPFGCFTSPDEQCRAATDLAAQRCYASIADNFACAVMRKLGV